MKIFYGWKIAAAGSGLQFLQAALLHQAFGAYLAVLAIERPDWSRTALAGAATLAPLEAALLGPALGWIIDRFGPQGMIRLGVLAMGAGFMLMSWSDTLVGFYGAFLVIALGSSLCGYFPINIAIIHWFERKRARAISMASLGLAVGGVAVPLVAWSMQTFGWRWAAFGSGLLMIGIGWPLARVFKRSPEEMGLTVDGLPAQAIPLASAAAAAAATHGKPAFSVKQALRTPAFWLISLGHGFALLVVQAVNVHAILHMKQALDYTVTQASLVISVMTLAQVAGVLTGGVVGDRFAKRKLAAGCMLMHAAGLLMLTYGNGIGMLMAFALLHGLGWGLRGPLMQAIRAEYFGLQAIGMIMGISALVISVGQIAGPLLAGWLADLTGDYRLGFTLIAVLVGLGSLFFWFAKKPDQPASAVAR